MRQSPARKSAPVSQSWIPIESLESLPEMEELLDSSLLVDSGQNRAVRKGSVTRPISPARPSFSSRSANLVETEPAKDLEKHEARKRSHRRWNSKRRTLHLKRKARVQKVFFSLLGVALAISFVGGATAYLSKSEVPANALGSKSSIPKFIPKKVDLIIEGNQTQVLSVASSLNEFQVQHGLVGLAPMQQRFEEIDSLKRSAPPVEFRYPKIISINVDSSTKTILATDLTVGQALNNNGVIVDGDDIVSVSLDASPMGVRNVSINRVSTSTRSAQEVVPFSVTNQDDSTLAKGKTSVKQSGVNGLADIIYTSTIQDGQVLSEVVSSRNIVKAPVGQIIRVGTKPLGVESGKASWYAHTPGTCAHKTLPFGTIVTVKNSNTGATTTCRVADRGPFGAGRIIDLTKDVFARIASISQGVVPVTISW